MVSAATLTAAIVIFATTCAIELALLRLAGRWQLVAVPNDRSSHQEATPTLGGLGFVVPIVGYLLLESHSPYQLSIVAAAVVLAATGLLDDLRDLGRGIRFLLQLGAVSAVLTWLDADWPIWWLVSVGFLMLWHVNLFNFMDGIDGIAGVQVLIFTFGALALGGEVPPWTAAMLVALSAGAAAFLVFNLPPAKIFMGDVGSLFLGLLLAVAALELAKTGALPLIPCLILLAGFWFDASYTLCVRALSGQNPTRAHRSHLYQKLARRFGHQRTTASFALFGLFWVFPLAALSNYYTHVAWLALLVAVAPMLIAAIIMKAGMPEQ